MSDIGQSQDAITEYRKLCGKRADEILEIMAKAYPFVSAWKSPIGQELIKLDVARLAVLMEKQYVDLDNMSQKELIEMRLVKSRIEYIIKKIEDFDEKRKQISGEIKKHDRKR